MKNKKDIKQKSQSDESDSKVGNYGKNSDIGLCKWKA